MKVRLSLFLAASSVAIIALPAFTSRLPRYGGTLVVDTAAAVNSTDPSVTPSSPDQARVKEHIDRLIYAREDSDGTFAGSGPFRMQSFTPGKDATLAADDRFEGGRPFLDEIRIQMGRSAQDRLIDLEIGKADIAEIPADQARRAVESGIRISRSQPDQLIALVFNSKSSAVSDPRVRQAVALTIDRAAIVNFILQKTGEPAGGLLPQWSSGTAFLFSTAADPVQAKQLWSSLDAPATISLGYDSTDSEAKAIAERIEVDAQGAGISMTAKAFSNNGAERWNGDARLVRLRMPSPVPQVALSDFVDTLNRIGGLNVSADGIAGSSDPGQIYNTELAIVHSYSVAPIAWIPQVYGLSNRVRGWNAPGPGEGWPLANVWLDNTDIPPGKAGS